MKIRAVRLQNVLIKYILAEGFALLFLAVLLVGARISPNDSLLPILRIVLMLFLLVMGLFADAGVMLPGLLPRVGPGLQVFFATICGIIDQLPGVGVMALHRHAAGVAMWLIAQPTIFPVLIVLLVEWFRADQAKAREEDARLDAVEASGGFVGLP